MKQVGNEVVGKPFDIHGRWHDSSFSSPGLLYIQDFLADFSTAHVVFRLKDAMFSFLRTRFASWRGRSA